MKIDARNLACPRPVVLALEALPKLAAGESLQVVVNESVAVGNLTRLAAEKNCDLATATNAKETTLTLTPRAAVSASESAEAEAQELCDIPASGASVIAVDTDSMGRGNEELGKILVKGFIYALAHQDKVPEKMLFFNGGPTLLVRVQSPLRTYASSKSAGPRFSPVAPALTSMASVTSLRSAA